MTKEGLDDRQPKGPLPQQNTSREVSSWAENSCFQKPAEMRFRQMATQKDIVRDNFLVCEVNGGSVFSDFPHETNHSQCAMHKTLISPSLTILGSKEMR